MRGTFLIFYVQEDRTRHGILVYEWLLKHARGLGLKGGSAVKAIAGFGRHGLIHADHFIELAGDLPVEVSFMASDEEADRLLASIGSEGLSMFYVRIPAECGVLNPEVHP
jgi:PII-like signaling protein